jgi:hypothetical protein
VVTDVSRTGNSLDATSAPGASRPKRSAGLRRASSSSTVGDHGENGGGAPEDDAAGLSLKSQQARQVCLSI